MFHICRLNFVLLLQSLVFSFPFVIKKLLDKDDSNDNCKNDYINYSNYLNGENSALLISLSDNASV